MLLYMSRDYVGDMAETVALLWPKPPDEPPEIDDATIRITDAIERLRSATRLDAPRALASMLDHLDASGRFALLKLATGALRVGISARLAKQALADAFGLEVEAVEEVWHGLTPAVRRAVRLGRGPRRAADARATCRCSARSCSPIRSRRPRSRSTIMRPSGNGTGSASSSSMPAARRGSTAAPATTFRGSFPDVAEAFRTPGVLDGELLVRGSDQGVADVHGGAAASFNALQQRLGRKNVSQKMLGAYPAFVRLYDILFDGDEDLRELAVGASGGSGSKPSPPSSIPSGSTSRS